jgi:hypothetical protein
MKNLNKQKWADIAAHLRDSKKIGLKLVLAAYPSYLVSLNVF